MGILSDTSGYWALAIFRALITRTHGAGTSKRAKFGGRKPRLLLQPAA